MPQDLSFGPIAWARDDLIKSLEEFAQLYAQRPIQDNQGGMKAPHMFYTWFVLKSLRPKTVIESGVWRGQSSWLIEQACPEADLHCIDIDLSRLVYRSSKAKYYTKDFASIDWTGLEPRETLIFFDDHQNAYERLKTAYWFGFQDIIFEDNYPAGLGDVYSLKAAFAGAGFRQKETKPSFKQRLAMSARLLLKGSAPEAPKKAENVEANSLDAFYLRKNLAAYYEFPPVFKLEKTRWGDAWEEGRYPTASPLLKTVEKPFQQIYYDEADSYTWLCYLRLKQNPSLM